MRTDVGLGRHVRWCCCALALLATPSLAAQSASTSSPIIEPNDNRQAAGHLSGGVLRISLELRDAVWKPDTHSATAIPVFAFAEEGQPPRDPGPLIRVDEGTTVQVSLHNRLAVTARVHGLHERPGNIDEAIVLEPGARREVSFASGPPGTYFYWADTRTTGLPAPIRIDEDTELAGAFIVDRRGAPHDDRVFVVNLWLTRLMESGFREQLAINGRAWPDSERLTVTEGVPVHWRIVNPTISDHAMHLHGFFYTVTGAGDSEHFTYYTKDEERHVVTEHVDTGQTYDMTWVPERPGNWLFHCHMVGHMTTETAPELSGPTGPAVPTLHAHGEGHSGMYGLVLGITVNPSGLHAATGSAPAIAARQLHLAVRERPASRYVPGGPGFVLDGSNTSPGVVGPPIVLTRGEPAEITVTNETGEPTAIHWHGIELESRYDGVPGWAGSGAALAPEIPAGGTFVARMTPPRAGTYIYHTHWHDVAQLTSGLYGPLIVIEPGTVFDPATDKTLVIGRAGPDAFRDPILLNGSAQPLALELTAKVSYRLRFINMTPNDSYLTISLVRDGRTVQWRALAKDGAALPAPQARLVDASQLITVGETFDFEFTPPAPGVYELAVATPTGAPPVQKLTQVVVVADKP